MASHRNAYRALMSTSCLCLVVGLGSVGIPQHEAHAANWAGVTPDSGTYPEGKVVSDGLTVTYQPNDNQTLKQINTGGTVKIDSQDPKSSGRTPAYGLTLVQDGPGTTILQSNQDYPSTPILDSAGNPIKDSNGNIETVSHCDSKVNCINYQVRTIVKQGTLLLRGNADTVDDHQGFIQGTLPNTTVEVQKEGVFDISQSNGWRNVNGSSSGVEIGGLKGSGTIHLGSTGQIYLHSTEYDKDENLNKSLPFGDSIFTGTITAYQDQFQSSGLVIDQKTLQLGDATTNTGAKVDANLIWVGNSESEKATLNIEGGSNVHVFHDMNTGISVTNSNNSATNGAINISGSGTKVTVDGGIGIASADWYFRAKSAAESGDNISPERKQALELGLSQIQGAVSISDGAVVKANTVSLGYTGVSNNYWTGIVAGNGTLNVGQRASDGSAAHLIVGLTEDPSQAGGYVPSGSADNQGLWVNARGNGTVNINDGGQVTTSRVTLGAPEEDGKHAGAVHGTLNLNEGGLLQVLGQGADASHDNVANFNNAQWGQSGTFALNGGTLQAIGGDLYGSADITLNKPDSNHLSTIDSNNHNVSLSGQMTGEGGFKKVSAGTLTLGALALKKQDDADYLANKGRNTYAGGTDIEQGKVSGTAGSFGTGTVSVAKDATLDVDQETSVSSDAATPADSANTTNTLGNSLAGQGEFDKRGAGTLYYTGDGREFSGNVNVQAGNMVVNGDLSRASNLAVAKNAGLAGTGTVGNTDVSGTLSPGQKDNSHSIGTLNVNGDLTMRDGSTFYADADETKQQPGQNDSNQRATDLVKVSGKADLSGANLHFNVLGNTPLQSGELYKLVDAQGGVTSQFKGWNQDAIKLAYPYLRSNLTYTNNTAQVTITDNRKPETPPNDNGSNEHPNPGGTGGNTNTGGSNEHPNPGGTGGNTNTGGSNEHPNPGGTGGNTNTGGSNEHPNPGGTGGNTNTGGSNEHPNPGGTGGNTNTGGSNEHPNPGGTGGNTNTGGSNEHPNSGGTTVDNNGGTSGHPNTGDNTNNPPPTPQPPTPQPPTPQPPTPQVPNFHLPNETRNERASAIGLGQMVAATAGGGALGDAVVNLQTQEAHNGLNALSGEIYGSTKTAMVNDSFYLRDAALNRLDCAGDAVRGSSMSDKAHKPGYCDVDPSRPVTVWGQIYGSRGGNSGSGSDYLSASHLNQSAIGWIMGADAEVQGWRVGGLLAYGRSMFSNGGSRSSNGSANNASLGVYGGTSWRVGGVTPDAKVTLKLGATYTWNVLQTHRRIEIPGFSDRTKSNSLAGTAQAFAETGYRFVVQAGSTPFEIEPFARMTYVSYQQGGYHEHGGLAALSVKSQQSNLGYSTFGVKAATSFQLGDVTLSPHGSLAYRHAFGALRGTARERFNHAGGGYGYDMNVIGTPISADTAVIDSGISAKLTNRLSVQVDYVGQYGSHLTTSGGTGKLSYTF